MATEHLAKRRRSNSEEPPELVHGVPWYSDGSVVLQAEDTQFRVHKSIMSECSPVLKTLLEAQTDQKVPTVEGCPILYLDDTKENIEYLITTFYGRR